MIRFRDVWFWGQAAGADRQPASAGAKIEIRFQNDAPHWPEQAHLLLARGPSVHDDLEDAF
jgi:hypothetical protein